MKAPVMLSTERVVIHIHEKRGVDFVMPATGNYELTEDEWQEYCAVILERNVKTIRSTY